MSGPNKDKPCDEWAEKLTQVARLSPADQEALAEHVKSCAPCSAALAQYRIMHEYLQRSLAAEPLAEMPALSWQLPRRGFRLPTLVAFLPAMGIALLVGLLFLVLGQLIAQIIAHVPGTPLVWTMPLTPLATALILALFVVTRESAWNDPVTRPYARPRPSRPYVPQTGKPGSVKKIAESSPTLLHTRRRGWHYRGLLLIVILSLLAVSASSLAILALNPSLIHTNNMPGASSAPAPVQSAEPTGISFDGSQAFDVTRANGDLKLAAAAKIRAHDIPAAEVLWQQALAVDSGDAETRIYQEDQRVLASHHPYFTLVLGTILGKGYLSGGRDDLQGVYIAQREYNDQADRITRPLLRLLVASSTFDTVSPADVARQVVEAARQDATIKGVMGWPTTASAQASLPILAAAHIPMLSASASGDTLTGQSPYFFRLSPTNTFQEEFAARYVKNVLHAKRVALFEDPNDPFSRTLADAFVKYFSDANHTVIMQANYVKGHPESLPALVKLALAQHPDLLYFSGYASDASMVLKNLPACTSTSCLLVMGGEAFYLQADYALNDLANYTRLRFTSFAFPGLWRIQHREQPRFFRDYAQTFDPNGQYRAGTYGYNQPEGHTILSYDAIQVLLYASNTLQDSPHFTPTDLRRALTHIAPAQPFQGVSGPIAFGPNGDNTLGKVMVLAGNTQSSPDGNIRLDYGEEVP